MTNVVLMMSVMASGEVYAVVSVVTPASRRSLNALEQTDLFANETAVRLRLTLCSIDDSQF